MIERMFDLHHNNTTVAQEIMAGMVTFMTMAYIIFVNPSILAEAMGKEYLPALTVATCLAAGIATICMGLLSNSPFALASGMGLNAFAAYGVILGMKLPWPTVMGIIFIEGTIVTLLVLTNVREWVMDAIPLDLKRAMGVGIGLFIAFIGLKNASLVVTDPVTYLTFGQLGQESLIALAGLILTAVLIVRKIKGSILLGILFSSLLGLWLGLAKFPDSWVMTVRPEYFSTFFKLDIRSALHLGLATTIFTFLITDFFDTMGTIVAVGEEAGFITKEGKFPRLRSVLLIDSLAAVLGALFGCSSVTTYVESTAGVAEGGRTGLTSVVTGLLFVLAVFIAPVVCLVPSCATAPALIMVGVLMLSVVKTIRWDDMTVALPAALTILMIPLTFSISKGIGYGFISYVLICVLTGKGRQIHPLMAVSSVAFGIDFFLSSIG